MKYLIGVFNAGIWSLLLWVLFCIISSIVTWSNYFSVGFSEWDGVFRLIMFIGVSLLVYVCVPFKNDKH